MASVQDIIRQKALEYGVDPTTALAIAKIESNFNPAPTTGNGGGLFQLDQDWWKQYGNGQNINDPTANADAFMRYYKGSLLPGLTKALGHMPTPGEIYLGHQQGIQGATALLQNPDRIAADTISGFYPNLATATSAITGNGGRKDMTGAQFASLWNDRLNSAARSIDPNFAGANSTVVGTPRQPAMMLADAAPAATPAVGGAALDALPTAKKNPFTGLLAQGLSLAQAGGPPPSRVGGAGLMAMAHPANLQLMQFDPFKTLLNKGTGLLSGDLT